MGPACGLVRPEVNHGGRPITARRLHNVGGPAQPGDRSVFWVSSARYRPISPARIATVARLPMACPVVIAARRDSAVSKLLLGTLLVSLAVAGCQQKTEEIVVLRPAIAWEDIAPVPVQGVADGFVNLAPEGTDGLFPASVAIARVALEPGGVEDASDSPSGSGRLLILDVDPTNDLLPWNSLFDSLRYVHDAFPLHGHDLSGEDPLPAQLAAAAAQLRAGLCLVYSAGDLSESDSRVRGVIYDTQSGQPLAAVEASVSVPEPEAVPHPPDLVKDDMRYCDPRFLAGRRFEQLVFDCLRNLKSRDRPVPAQREEGWTPEGPVWPRTWPPGVIGAP